MKPTFMRGEAKHKTRGRHILLTAFLFTILSLDFPMLVQLNDCSFQFDILSDPERFAITKFIHTSPSVKISKQQQTLFQLL